MKKSADHAQAFRPVSQQVGPAASLDRVLAKAPHEVPGTPLDEDMQESHRLPGGCASREMVPELRNIQMVGADCIQKAGPGFVVQASLGSGNVPQIQVQDGAIQLVTEQGEGLGGISLPYIAKMLFDEVFARYWDPAEKTILSWGDLENTTDKIEVFISAQLHHDNGITKG
jgi:hypothetical protein